MQSFVPVSYKFLYKLGTESVSWLSLRLQHMFKYNHMVKKVHNAYRAVSLIRFQNILQKGAGIVILVLNWGETEIGRDGVLI